jgi:polyketide synthase PksN
LVAIHRAVRAIHAGDCEQALVGGINTIVTPWAHISFSKAGMLSEDGRCKTFSKHANGYVRGEGVGMLFLKPVSGAERDGDHIYGLIRSTSQNHGGRASSLTAPNPKAQAELLKAAYREAGIDPRTVTYIETHGTGTPLGDPIEINGLKSAFAELYQDELLGGGPIAHGYCGIGSVKTNIGHLELAAGVAGMIKVLLQLKHKTLAKNLHCEEINPLIQLAESPFFIVRETGPWNALRSSDGYELPRRAGISSFGFGGVNAHVIMEEYIEPPAHANHRVMVAPEYPALVVLSGKNAERLQERARQLLNRIQNEILQEHDLVDLAYTLQVGREPMEQRLAFTATTLAEVKEKLNIYLGDGSMSSHAVDLYVGDVKKNKETVSTLNEDDDTFSLIDTWLGKGKYVKLLELWVKGLRFDWLRLYGEGTSYGEVSSRRRLSLPTYPFAKRRCWVETKAHAGALTAHQTVATSAASELDIVSVIDRHLANDLSGSEAAKHIEALFLETAQS